jgi:hypothetical protein
MMWLLVGVLIAVVCFIPFPYGLVVGGGLILGALFWIIDLLVQIRNKLPSPVPLDPHLLAKESRGLPRHLAPARKYRLQRPQ